MGLTRLTGARELLDRERAAREWFGSEYVPLIETLRRPGSSGSGPRPTRTCAWCRALRQARGRRLIDLGPGGLRAAVAGDGSGLGHGEVAPRARVEDVDGLGVQTEPVALARSCRSPAPGARRPFPRPPMARRPRHCPRPALRAPPLRPARADPEVHVDLRAQRLDEFDRDLELRPRCSRSISGS